MHPTLLDASQKIGGTALNFVLVLPAALTALVASYWVAGVQSRRFPGMGISGIDIHKLDRPVRAEMGGIAILVGLTAGSAIYLVSSELGGGLWFAFGAVFSTIAFTGLVGVADDRLVLSQRLKPFLIVAASAPIMYYLLGRSSVFIPTIGSVNLGLLYPLVAVPLAETASANFANLLAGFNGLEAGCASISLGTMSLIAYITGQPSTAAFGIVITFAFLGFLRQNWYPSKIFPGDTGTLVAGSALAAMGLSAGLEFQAIILSVPAAMDFTLKVMHRHPFKQRSVFGNTKIRPDGTLMPPDYPAVVHAFMRVSPVNEKGLVSSVLVMQALYAGIALAVTLLFYR